ncbi:MAG: valine--tRNA ligase [bacterium]|nr:valine--tRNA ligase [bacterium]MDY4108410.1 valine--tRNA ligase [Bacilli bacterium]
MLDSKYNHKLVEEGKYEIWKSKGYFTAGKNKGADPYCIVIPPPNVTGNLHLGHAYDVSIQDAIIRYKRMQGFDTLWLPGMDHAAIATEAKVVKRLKDKGINKYEYGREKFLDACWDWTKEYGENIRNQWGVMGVSVDYTRERFTLDEGLNKAVTKVFVDYYNKGLIYRGEKIINWDPAARTALSNEEVVYKEIDGAFYHIKYKLENSEEYLDVATTRPETLFGDTAVAVNENDERYKKFVGKNVVLPFMNKVIPVITDEHADMEKGTGVVKITPAHDPNDFEVGNRHNLERICIMNDDATMNEVCPLKYQGMTREECRKVLIEDLKEAGLLIGIEPLKHEVGHSERTGVMVEPMIKKQWFVNMKTLSANLLENQKNDETKVHFIPGKFENTLKAWMEDCHDWCISRQLWWGHRIPAWYKDDKVYVGYEAPKESGWVQDEDVLDTWFSSALWPFSTLGWPEETEDLKKYFPTDCLVTGYDIIFFWVSRMMFQSLELNGVRPFKDCVIHGLIRDKDGRKMSKSLGNGIDPFDMTEKYGCDALRYYLNTDCALGTDLRFDETKMSATWNYINKIWNASRFVLSNIEDLKEIKLDNLSNEDKWILTKYENIVKSSISHMDRYEFNLFGLETYNFIYDDFCSNYIEFAKFNLDKNSTKSTLLFVLTGILKMLHPFMPFVTEEIYSMLPVKESESIMISSYPIYEEKYIFEKEYELTEKSISFIRKFRNVCTENTIPKTAPVMINNSSDYNLIIKVLRLQDRLINEKENINSYDVNEYNYSMSIFYQKEENLELIKKEMDTLRSNIERREKLLSNPGYVNKAPENLVAMERDKLEIEKNKLKELEEKYK